MDRLKELATIIDKDRLLVDELMNKHTTFRVGGPADFYAMPSNIEEVKGLVEYCQNTNLPYYVIGNGSNLLVGDKGFRGLIIQIAKNMSDITVEGSKVTASAGALLSRVARIVLDKELTGFEFAAGIPGTVGGAVRMNAGAYGGEMKDIIVSADVIDNEGNVITLNNEELKLSYRSSVVSEKEYIVLSAVYNLRKGNKEAIQSVMDDLKNRRVTKQPLEFASAGSTFKRPEGYFAGKLIEDCGLKGFSVGDAQVSEKHCGFVINRGNATAKDIVDLMDKVSEKVKEEFGVTLEPEVRRIGEF